MHASHKQRVEALTAKPRRVEVEWIDSAAHPGWNISTDLLDDIEREDALKCWSCGYMINEGVDHITLALSYNIDPRTGLHGEYGDTITIPRVALVGVRDLRR
jgi:hypothetical protein